MCIDTSEQLNSINNDNAMLINNSDYVNINRPSAFIAAIVYNLFNEQGISDIAS